MVIRGLFETLYLNPFPPFLSLPFLLPPSRHCPRTLRKGLSLLLFVVETTGFGCLLSLVDGLI